MALGPPSILYTLKWTPCYLRNYKYEVNDCPVYWMLICWMPYKNLFKKKYFWIKYWQAVDFLKISFTYGQDKTTLYTVNILYLTRLQCLLLVSKLVSLHLHHCSFWWYSDKTGLNSQGIHFCILLRSVTAFLHDLKSYIINLAVHGRVKGAS